MTSSKPATPKQTKKISRSSGGDGVNKGLKRAQPEDPDEGVGNAETKTTPRKTPKKTTPKKTTPKKTTPKNDVDPAFSVQRQAQATHAEEIVDNFVADTFAVRYTSSTGRAYVVRGVRNEDYSEHEPTPNTWPRCLNIEDTLVTGAMVDVTDSETPRLVGIWAFSVCGDETVEYDLDTAKEEVWDFIEASEDKIDGEWNDAFSVSSGDEAVSFFDCPLATFEACRKLVALPPVNDK